MENTVYAAEELWLTEYFHYWEEIDISDQALVEMYRQNITLPDVLCALSCPQILDYERDASGCEIVVTGRTCDDEFITVFGGFSSERMVVWISSVSR